MKKIIIAAALVLTSAVTAFSLNTNTTAKKAEDARLKKDALILSIKPTTAPKSDIGIAD